MKKNKKKSRSATVVSVSKLGHNVRKVGPVLVNFEHGIVDPNAWINFEPKISVKFGQSLSETPDIDISIKTDHLTYSSQRASAKGFHSKPLSRSYLAIRNRKTDKIRVVELSRVSVAAEFEPPPTTNPFLLKSKTLENCGTIDGKVPNEEEIRLASKKHLVMQFGQKNRRRHMEMMGRNQVDQNLLEEKMSEALGNVDDSIVDSKEAGITKVKSEKIILDISLNLVPKCNRAAHVVENVYPVENVLSEQDVEILAAATEAIFCEYENKQSIANAVSTGIFSELFGTVLMREVSNYSAFASQRRLACGLFSEGILKFLFLSRKDLQRGPSMLPSFVPASIQDRIFHLFRPNGDMEYDSKDRAFCYATIFMLTASGFRLDFNALTCSVKLKTTQIRRLIQVIGASLQTECDGQRSVILKLPLTTFIPFKPARNKGKRDRKF